MPPSGSHAYERHAKLPMKQLDPVCEAVGERYILVVDGHTCIMIIGFDRPVDCQRMSAVCVDLAEEGDLRMLLAYRT